MGATTNQPNAPLRKLSVHKQLLRAAVTALLLSDLGRWVRSSAAWRKHARQRQRLVRLVVLLEEIGNVLFMLGKITW